ncbi:hypothetical protein [Acinetobacter sp. YH12023]|nr:hypothetical protein [Acinetobacter sp. YH12023]
MKYVEISNAVSSGGDAVQHRPSNYCIPFNLTESVDPEKIKGQVF